MNQKLVTKWLNIITIALTGSVAIIGFILSYTALYKVAAANSDLGRLAYLWPLVIDLALIAFSVWAIRNVMYKRNPWVAYTLILIFSISTIAFNVLNAPDTPLAPFVALFPPIAMVLTLEAILAMLRQDFRKLKVSDIKAIPPVPTETAKRGRPTIDDNELLRLHYLHGSLEEVSKQTGLQVATLKKRLKNYDLFGKVTK